MHFSRAKRTLLENGNAQSVAIFSRINGNSNKWKFELKFLNIRTKMEFHLFASILYSVLLEVPWRIAGETAKILPQRTNTRFATDDRSGSQRSRKVRAVPSFQVLPGNFPPTWHHWVCASTPETSFRSGIETSC